MVCLVEGGILDKKDPQYSNAVNDALYGICINGNQRLTYDKDTNLRFEKLVGHCVT